MNHFSIGQSNFFNSMGNLIKLLHDLTYATIDCIPAAFEKTVPLCFPAGEIRFGTRIDFALGNLRNSRADIVDCG